jgi:hypothetical protein
LKKKISWLTIFFSLFSFSLDDERDTLSFSKESNESDNRDDLGDGTVSETLPLDISSVSKERKEEEEEDAKEEERGRGEESDENVC